MQAEPTQRAARLAARDAATVDHLENAAMRARKRGDWVTAFLLSGMFWVPLVLHFAGVAFR